MPPPKKPKNKESWEEFISESQAESSVNKQEDSLGCHTTDNPPFSGPAGIQAKGPADCPIRFVTPGAPVTLVPEDLSNKPDKNGCLKTLSNSVQEILQEAIMADGMKHVQDCSTSSEHHPQLRNILLRDSRVCTTPDVGEKLISSVAALQDQQMTRVHSCPPGSPNSSDARWKNPSMHVSTNEFQTPAAFSTNSPSGSKCEELCLLENDGYEKVRIPGCMQTKPEDDGLRLSRRDQNFSGSSNVVRDTWPHDTVYRDGGRLHDPEKSWTECYLVSQTNGPFDPDRKRLGPQVPTADSTTHMVYNSAHIKRSRLNAERLQARQQQELHPHRGQNSATERSSQELHAQGPKNADPDRGDLGQPRQQNPSSGFSSPEIHSHSQTYVARLFAELQRKGIPIMDYLLSLDSDLHQPRRQSGPILSRLPPNGGFQGVSRSQNSPRTPPRGKPQSEVGFGPRKGEKGSPSGNKSAPTLPCPPSLPQTKMATLQALLSDDAEPWVATGNSSPSGEANRVITADSGAAQRLHETGDMGRMEERHDQWSVELELLENANSPEKPARMGADVHGSPEMPSSSSCNEQGRSKADEKGVCRCQICDDVASGFHYGVWSCEGCKAFFKRSLHGPVDYVCPATNNCTIDKLRRKSCQACRLRKCHEAGMTAGMSRKEKGVRPTGKKRKAVDEELSTSDPDTAATSSSFGKIMRYNAVGSPRDASQQPDLSPGREMKHSPSSFSASTSNGRIGCQDSAQPNALVERLLAIELPARDAEFSHFITNSSLQLLSGLLGLINSQLIDIITWSKALPDFSKSSLPSRTRLLVSSWSEMLVLGTVWQSVPQPNVWACATNLLLTRAHCKLAMIEPLYDRIMLLVQTFRRLQLTKMEMVLLRLTVLLNSDASIIESQAPLANLRNLLDETWQQIPLDETKASRSRLSHLLLTLPDIRQCSLMMLDVINNTRHRQGVPSYSLLHEMLDCDVPRTAEMRPPNTSVE